MKLTIIGHASVVKFKPIKTLATTKVYSRLYQAALIGQTLILTCHPTPKALLAFEPNSEKLPRIQRAFQACLQTPGCRFPIRLSYCTISLEPLAIFGLAFHHRWPLTSSKQHTGRATQASPVATRVSCIPGIYKALLGCYGHSFATVFNAYKLPTRQHPPYGFLQPIKSRPVPFLTLTLNFMLALLLTKQGFNAIILMTCKFSKQVTFVEGADT